MAAYGKSHAATIEWLVILLVGLVVQVALFALLPLQHAPAWVWALTTLPFFAAFAIAVLRQRAADRRRIADIASAIRARGFTIESESASARVASGFEAVRHLQHVLQLKDGAQNAKWVAGDAMARCCSNTST